MDIIKAIKEAQKGHKIRRASWGPRDYIYLYDIDYVNEWRDQEDKAFMTFVGINILADDWEYYVEKPQKHCQPVTCASLVMTPEEKPGPYCYSCGSREWELELSEQTANRASFACKHCGLIRNHRRKIITKD